MEEKAFAKINLSLEVIGRRDDGYHDILSLMAAIKMYDLLKLRFFEKRTDKILNLEILTSGPYKSVIDGLPDEKNLIYRAAAAYLDAINSGADMVLEIEKNIPAGAGLGGGSADAAAVLRILNRIYKLFDLKKLEIMASGLGADVPFCVSNGFSICEGIGDVIEHLEGKLPYSVLVVNNGVHLNTLEAYKYIDSIENMNLDGKNKKNHFRKLINQGMLDGRCNSFINDFENAVFSRFASVQDLKSRIANSGAIFALMTGSGSTVFGLYDDISTALKAVEQFSGVFETVCLTDFLNQRTEIY